MRFSHPILLPLIALAAFAVAGAALSAPAAAAVESCGQRLSIGVHYLPTKYIYSVGLKRLKRLAGESVWGLYRTQVQYGGRWTQKGSCVNVRIDVKVHSRIYVAKELKSLKYQCQFKSTLAHEKRHREDDKRSLRNMLKKRNALINKMSKGKIKDLDQFINYTIGKLDKMITKYYREMNRRSDAFHQVAKNDC